MADLRDMAELAAAITGGAAAIKEIATDPRVIALLTGRGGDRLPDGYSEFTASVGAAANTTGGLPNGFRRVIAPNGDIEYRGPDGTIYSSIDDLPSGRNGILLNHQLTAQEIAGGHGFIKHVLGQGEFAGLGIRTRQQYAAHIENVLNNATSVRYTTDGRSFHLHQPTGTVVVRNPKALDGGTAFQPQNWDGYVSQLPIRTEPYDG